jgi:hypothetical protein
VRSHFDSRPDSQQLADLKFQTEELERKLSDARLLLERELAQSAWENQPAPGFAAQTDLWALEQMAAESDRAGQWAPYTDPEPPVEFGDADQPAWAAANEDRTEVLVSRGRRSARSRRLPRGYKVDMAAAVGVVVVTVAIGMLLRSGPSWPASVATVQAQAAQACRNPDVQSEPGQVNFACAAGTRQILWVFALLTSGNNPNFLDGKTGRRGLEPIAPAQGGEVAWSLNLHHPYDPANPVDSLQVAARAINNIIGGATVTGTDGNPVVQAGLESSPANCVRYTGSAAVTSRQGFPAVCARPITTAAGRAALVADVYLKWVVGAPPSAAQDAALLFQHASNPGDPQVQAILKHLPGSRPLG